VRRAQLIGEERLRIGEYGENLGFELRAILTVRDEVPDELLRELDRLAHRHTEADEVFGVHGFWWCGNGGRGVRTHSEYAAVFVHFIENGYSRGRLVALPGCVVFIPQSRNAMFAIVRVVFSVFIQTWCQPRSVIVAWSR
jgi:hypothetical protein